MLTDVPLIVISPGVVAIPALSNGRGRRTFSRLPMVLIVIAVCKCGMIAVGDPATGNSRDSDRHDLELSRQQNCHGCTRVSQRKAPKTIVATATIKHCSTSCVCWLPLVKRSCEPIHA